MFQTVALRNEVIFIQYPNMSQLLILLNNEKDVSLSKIIPTSKFHICFISHIKEVFNQMGYELINKDPVLLEEVEGEQEISLSLNGTDLGELFIIHDSVSNNTSLVYYSPYGLIESNLFNYEDYEEYTLSDYVLLLKEFSSHLYGEHILYRTVDN